MVVVLYEEFFKHEAIYHIMETLKVRPQSQADKEYSSLISLPPPLNAFLVFLAPFLLTSKNPEIWNKVILWVAYLPILIITTTVFFLYNICLLPLAYVKMFFHKLVMIFVYSKSYRVARADKFILTVVFIVIGPIRLFMNVIVDTIAFIQHSMLSELKKTKVAHKHKPFSKESLLLLNKYLHERQERLMPFKQIAQETRDKMGVFQTIASILQPWGVGRLVGGHRIANRVNHEENFEHVFMHV